MSVPEPGGSASGRVVRVDRGAVLVLPEDAAGSEDGGPADADGSAGVSAGPDAGGRHAVRVVLPGDGLVPVLDADGAPGELVPPAVGDEVLLGAEGEDATLRVVAVLPRRTAVVRDGPDRTSRAQVLAANVDVVLVVEHLDPDPSPGRVERLLTLAWRSGAQPVVVLTKADLVPDPEGMADEVRAVAIGADVHTVSVTAGTGLEPLRALLRPGWTLVVVGPSGAGKSTLVNALAGAEVMATGDRRADGRGRHTTVHRELVPLPGGANLIDTPGLRGVGLVADSAALETTFADITALAGDCRFADCAHRSEPGCAVLAAVDDGSLSERRLDSWRRLAREAAYQERRSDSALAAAERHRSRRATAAYHRFQRSRPPR
ncbi:ribosome small subunit-dependent GTPase A [Cellulomonas sp. C5510]|uniref:ribosome small subunit-dependent GTPase A n=1 Tax=Cellulomonas sp. C5510 TaxID=2871170 RepID=UPI001C9622FF|nr:ribosome small subunit-dependent GTPase A [Cellulomonas sp. C5510]QZN85230.1 ribosome small subunit-dependent GTPase A [Cellulomonas sp. C5510]